MKRRESVLFSVLMICVFLLPGCRCGNSDINNGSDANNGGSGVLQAPNSLMVASVSSTHIGLSWEGNSDNEDGFRIERRLSDNDYAEIALVPADATTYPSAGLVIDTLYYYRIRAYNASNSSDYSNEVSAITSNSLDKWGGDSRIQNPHSKYQTGTITSVTEFTLTDTSNNWIIDELSGSILQPNTNNEIYYLIKSNAQNTITIYGSNVPGHEEELNRFINTDNDAQSGDEYAVLDRWSVQKVNKRWSLFDPYGNAFFIKSINAFMSSRYSGFDFEGNTVGDNLMIKNSVDTVYEAFVAEIDVLKEMGFNCFGELTDPWRLDAGALIDVKNKDSTRLVPFIEQVIISGLGLSNTDSFNMNSIYREVWDAQDNDFQSDMVFCFENAVAGGGATIELFDNRASWASNFLTPYRHAKYTIPSNPYFIGFDWDEEPRYLSAEASNAHMGYYILINGSLSQCKIKAVEFLQEKYSTIGNLNTAWGAGFSDWDALQSATADQIDPFLSAEPSCRDYGNNYDKETNIPMKEDLDSIAEKFWRVYTKKVHDAFDEITAVHMLNFGPGYHGTTGNNLYDFDGSTSPEYLFRGSVSEDGSIPYIDIIGVGDPLHGPHTSKDADTLEVMRNDLKERYEFHGRPYWHESCWVTAEADSGITFTGTIDGLTSTVLTDNDYNFQTLNEWGTAFGSIGGMHIIPNVNIPQEERVFYRISEYGSADGSLTVDLRTGSGNNWNYDLFPNLLDHASVGDTYVITHPDPLGGLHGGVYNLYTPLTQEERAEVYVHFLGDLIGFQADNGDYIDVGYSQFGFIDYGFRDGIYEMRNWGFMTIKGNLYDGVQATIANGEIQDCGNFTGPVSEKLNSIYNDITQISGK